MATLSETRDRLQPALLDRITDESPQDRQEGDDRRVMSKPQLRQAVLRDLAWLFNAVQPLGRSAEAYPGVAASVLNFGLPPMSGLMASKVDITQLERTIRQAILRFEPRVLPDTLQVTAVESTSLLEAHNLIEFEIHGHMWAQPVPLEILLRTQLDLEAGQVDVRDAAGQAPARMR